MPGRKETQETRKKEMEFVIRRVASEIETTPLRALEGLEKDDRVQAAQTACILRGFLGLDKDAQQAILNGDTSRLFTYMDIEATLDTDAAEFWRLYPTFPNYSKTPNQPYCWKQIQPAYYAAGRGSKYPSNRLHPKKRKRADLELTP